MEQESQEARGTAFTFIQKYFELRGLSMPNPQFALNFLVTEVGELMDAFIRGHKSAGFLRNNPDKESDLVGEIGDTFMMLAIFSQLTTGLSPFDCLLYKADKKLTEDQKKEMLGTFIPTPNEVEDPPVVEEPSE